MRSEADIIALVLGVAEKDERIRAVLLTGSRANPDVQKDRLQDFDIIYVVTNINSFTASHQWIDVFGERIIMQLPDEMTIGEKDQHAFHYLMLFTDTNRIDLTLFPLDKINDLVANNSLLQVLSDKDCLFAALLSPCEKSYYIKPPDEQAFSDCCNEYWWVSTYVAKGLWRKEIIYAKAMLEEPVRTMFLQIIEWYIGCNNTFNIAFGKNGRHIRQLVSPQLYTKILSTYPDAKIENIWTALFAMNNLFDTLAKEVAGKLHFHYNQTEAKQVINYLQSICAMRNE